MTESRRIPFAIGFLTALATIILLLVMLTASSRGAPPNGSADLSVTKTDAKDPVQPGAPVDYTIKVTNNGPDTAVGVVVIDKLPNGTTYISATSNRGTCALKGSKVTCDLGNLTKSGAYDTATIALRVTAPKKAGTITNTVDVVSDTLDPTKANNSASETTKVGAGGGVRRCLGSKATIVGTSGAETLRGTKGRDVIFAAGGDDLIVGAGGKDVLCGAGGKDVIKGRADDDRMSGGGGRDRLLGQDGDDTVKGGKRGDVLRGGKGNDLLAGGKGRDRCAGGPGKDVERSC